MSAERPRVIIVDDHPIVAQGLRALLTDSCDVVALVHDAREVVDAVARHRPDVLLLDVSMPHRSGLQLLRTLNEQFPMMRTIIVTMHVDQAFADSAMQSGAAGFIPKEAPADELRMAISVAMSGGRYLSSRVGRQRVRGDPSLSSSLLDRLTPRQQEILRLTAEGRTATEAAEILGLSPRTVEFHRLRIRKVLGITTESGLLRFAILASLAGTEPSPP